MILLIKHVKQCIFVPSYNENNKYTKGDKILYESETKHGENISYGKIEYQKNQFLLQIKKLF